MPESLETDATVITLYPADLSDWYGFALGDGAEALLERWVEHSCYKDVYARAVATGDHHGPVLAYLSHRDLLEQLVAQFLLPTLPGDLADRVTSRPHPMNHLLLSRTQDWEVTETLARMDELARMPAVPVTGGQVTSVCEAMFTPRPTAELAAFSYLLAATAGPGDPFADSPMAPEPPLGQLRTRLLDLAHILALGVSGDEMGLAVELVPAVDNDHLDSPALMAASRLKEAIRRARMVLR